MELLSHLKHPHPLVLSEEKYSDAFQCMVCRDCIAGLCYCCEECVFVVHKWCAELPLQLTDHYLHPDHPRLILLSYKEIDGQDAECVDCKCKISMAYAFSCEKCSFVLHPECALLPKHLNLEYNDADSKPVQTHLTFIKRSWEWNQCSLCKGGLRKSLFAGRNDSFHIQCALLPKTVKHDRHIHDLTLHVPIEEDKIYYGCICDLCEEDRDLNQWLYYCTGCKVAGHLSCGLLGSVPPNKAILTSNQVYAVEREVRIHRVDRTSKNAYMAELRRRVMGGLGKARGKLIHFSHEHPLFLHEEQWDVEYRCTACQMCIYGKIYVCSDCKFFLHKWCAELPKEVHFGFHFEHPLTLLSTHSLPCSYCGFKSGAFFFCCLECNYGVHTTCAFLFEFEGHKSHSHPLQVLIFTTYEHRWWFTGKFPIRSLNIPPPCNACLFPCEDMSLGCEECGFYLHIGCSLYPPTGKAKTHGHNLNLTYSYQDQRSDKFICNACEESRTPNCWVYCCPDTKCEIVTHLDCAVPNLFDNSSCEKEKEPNDWVYYRPSPLLHLHGLAAPVLDQPIQRILKSDPVYASFRKKLSENKLQHFSHEHPLVSSSEKWNTVVRCEICSTGIYGKTISVCPNCALRFHREMHFQISL